MPGTSDPYAAFRLNLEQQRKRAKDLLRAARAGDAAARRRLADAVALPVPDAVTIKLADAQFTIARELGFRTWRDLRTHVMAQAAAREAITQTGPAVDADMPTLHVRCGSDIKGELEAARFSGDFLAVWDSFPVGPVRTHQTGLRSAHAFTPIPVPSALWITTHFSRSSRMQTADSRHPPELCARRHLDRARQPRPTLAHPLPRTLRANAAAACPRADLSQPLSRLTAFHRTRPAPARSDVAALESARSHRC